MAGILGEIVDTTPPGAPRPPDAERVEIEAVVRVFMMSTMQIPPASLLSILASIMMSSCDRFADRRAIWEQLKQRIDEGIDRMDRIEAAEKSAGGNA